MRKIHLICVAFLLAASVSPSAHLTAKAGQDQTDNQGIALDPYTARNIDRIIALRNAAPGLTPEETIDLISRQFLGTPYVANRLIGSATRPEQLVIDFRGLDCFTYLDYVEALRHAQSRADFVQRLIQTRYVDGDISFLKRRHFFSDWAYKAPTLVRDITADISPKAVSIRKNLDAKSDGEQYVRGLPNVERTVTYIPSRYVDKALLDRLHTGDYIGAYTNRPGLDVSHTGIYVMTKNGPVLRNASSRKGVDKVVDSPFAQHVKTVPGIVVYRPRYDAAAPMRE
ncbi:DUF1460 domain-containing protein [Pseudorhodoplanes sinuspersici]|uniref:Uncharacterized protein n=1 Tax=Pseudorhodoplanes sinuspersici TaxID=1235591 RepID=A0A1W6ZYP9_9HYPH|nr:DUF1460 domain-containing protein [Pseudorhodoplanes sinuspersici]ARQ02271.1 hypothetical protein CAK95_26590 [Pseudorhodoplanes sinuspersici]RKE74094.1 uncharacterized protein DUF1460 [Pseudorhodoplanes sinuspersici]